MDNKEIKKEARLKLAGKWPKVFLITLIYLAITLALQYGSNTIIAVLQGTQIAKLTLSLVVLAATIPLSFGVISTFMDISRDKETKYTDFINKAILKFSKIWNVSFKIFFKVILPILILISVILIFILICAATFKISNDNAIIFEYIIASAYIIIMVIFFIKFLPYVLSFMVLADNPEMPAKDVLKKSAHLMKNRKIDYTLLCLSFFGWLLLISVIAYFVGILFKSSLILGLNENIGVEIIANLGIIFLAPYIITSQITFYEEANLESEEKE